MGYDLHITKAEHWIDAKQYPIALQAWLDLVEEDPELAVSSNDFCDQGKKGGGIERANPTVWHVLGKEVAFWFSDGEVTVKNPDDATVVKILDIADRLGARVIGDDGEVYGKKSSPPGWEISLA